MRHRKNTVKLGRTTAHNRALMANMLKSFIDKERIQTTVAKAKELRRHAERAITLAKKNTLASRRQLISRLQVRFNPLTPKEQRAAKGGDQSAFNGDRKVISKLIDTLGPRFATRAGGYTRIVKLQNRVGDRAPLCLIEFLND
jgi:large subunit ribosomal protein L17